MFEDKECTLDLAKGQRCLVCEQYLDAARTRFYNMNKGCVKCFIWCLTPGTLDFSPF